MTDDNFVQRYLTDIRTIVDRIDTSAIDSLIEHLVALRAREGRLFLLGVGGSAANCSHAVNDFRKLAHIEAYTPVDNVSELTARTNDEGWDTVFEAWLKTSRLNARDAVFVLSVGGGNVDKNISPNLVKALQYARQTGATVLGIVGRDGGFTATVADACVIVPTVNADTITPHAEAFQALIWHLLVSHPAVKRAPTKWESTVRAARAVFLDRDGVINRAIVRNGKPYSPAAVTELEILPGVDEAVKRLRAAGFRIVVVTNQPDVARGRQSKDAIEAMHAILGAQLGIDEFRVCYHDDGDRCACRKPEPGMILEAARNGAIDLGSSFVVGDRWRDILAGRRAGCSTILIDYGYDEPEADNPDARVASLLEAAEWILQTAS